MFTGKKEFFLLNQSPPSRVVSSDQDNNHTDENQTHEQCGYGYDSFSGTGLSQVD